MVHMRLFKPMSKKFGTFSWKFSGELAVRGGGASCIRSSECDIAIQYLLRRVNI